MVGLIVARSTNNVIGKNGQIPWKIKGEQRQFKELTTGNIVVMEEVIRRDWTSPTKQKDNSCIKK